MKFLRNLKKNLPTQGQIQEYRYLHILGDSLKQNELWSFNRISTSRGIAIGLFCAFLPMPFEMVPAIFIATALRGNLPFAVGGVWISNPVTWIPLYTPCYLLGSKIIRLEPIPIEQIGIFSLGWHYVALWLGCLIVGTILAFSTHFIISSIWALQIKQRWAQRKKDRHGRS